MGGSTVPGANIARHQELDMLRTKTLRTTLQSIYKVLHLSMVLIQNANEIEFDGVAMDIFVSRPCALVHLLDYVLSQSLWELASKWSASRALVH
ncbi:hypothetical protein PsorP6_015911 [Peronosclerospora sorghi]|uniref:Uncharacterized protein n=1 Tax=Peronosclerospora sorghi TaxID=230839 RepID=A0ACC0WQX1_9STRA|nr:hypothetical protein PsorP6_015911 [Peronosclerospora sorghi]